MVLSIAIKSEYLQAKRIKNGGNFLLERSIVCNYRSVALTGKVVAMYQCGHLLAPQTGDLVSIFGVSSFHRYLYCKMFSFSRPHQYDLLL